MPSFSPPTLKTPMPWKNLRVGLVGGSFNPPHAGHVHISLAAKKTLDLDVIWWLVTPQNPLKDKLPAPMDQRIEQCRALTSDHPSIIISDLERQLGTHITYDTIIALKKNFPQTDFVWIAGMDNAITFHTWNHWEDLLNEIPVLHANRMPATMKMPDCPLRHHAPQTNISVDMQSPKRYDLKPNTSFWLLNSDDIPLSSTQIRQQQKQ